MATCHRSGAAAAWTPRATARQQRERSVSAAVRAENESELSKLDEQITTLRRKPYRLPARHLRGFALLQAGQIEAALIDLQLSVGLAPGNGTAWTHLSVCRDRLGLPAAPTAQRALLLTRLRGCRVLRGGGVVPLRLRHHPEDATHAGRGGRRCASERAVMPLPPHGRIGLRQAFFATTLVPRRRGRCLRRRRGGRQLGGRWRGQHAHQGGQLHS